MKKFIKKILSFFSILVQFCFGLEQEICKKLEYQLEGYQCSNHCVVIRQGRNFYMFEGINKNSSQYFVYVKKVDANGWRPDPQIYNGVFNFKLNDVVVVENFKVFFIQKKKNSKNIAKFLLNDVEEMVKFLRKLDQIVRYFLEQNIYLDLSFENMYASYDGQYDIQFLYIEQKGQRFLYKEKVLINQYYQLYSFFVKQIKVENSKLFSPQNLDEFSDLLREKLLEIFNKKDQVKKYEDLNLQRKFNTLLNTVEIQEDLSQSKKKQKQSKKNTNSKIEQKRNFRQYITYKTTILVTVFLLGIFVVLGVLLRRKYYAVQRPQGFDEINN